MKSIVEPATKVEEAKAKLQKAEERCADAVNSRNLARAAFKEAAAELSALLNPKKDQKPKPAGYSAPLSPAQKRFLKALDDLGPSDNQELADELEVKPWSVARVANNLLARNVIEKLRDGKYALTEKTAAELRGTAPAEAAAN